MYALKRGKKAQITIFIIVAIVIILIIVGAIIAVRITSRVPGVGRLDVSSLKSALTGCFSIAAEDGLRKIGQHGGYISLTDPTFTRTSFRKGFTPVDGDYVTLGIDSGVDVPYWYYLSSRNDCNRNCRFSSKRPPLYSTDKSIQKQLERYVVQAARNCVTRELNKAKEEGFSVEELDAASADVLIRNKDVQFTVTLPLRITKDDLFKVLEPLVIVKKVPLKRIYDLASNITDLEKEYKYLEKQALDYIATFSQPIDETKLPPMEATDFAIGSNVYWLKSEVKEKVKDMLSDYVNFFFLDENIGSKRYYLPAEEDELIRTIAEQILNNAQIPLDDHGYGVRFIYQPWWDTYFDLNCDGEICKPLSYTNTFGGILFGYQDYRFYYDVSYPVIVSIIDEKADCCSPEGYRFMFAMESNVRANTPLSEDYVLEQPPEVEQNFCDVANKNILVPVNVTDKVTGKPIDGVVVTLKVADNDCFVGVTKQGFLEGLFPSGVIGKLEFMHPDYANTFADIVIPGSSQVNAQMEPFKDVTVNVVKKRVSKNLQTGVWSLQTALPDRELDYKESAIVMFDRIKEGPFEPDVFVSAKLTRDEPTEKIKLIRGRYRVEVQTINEQPLVVEPDDRSFQVKTGIPFQKKTITLIIPEEPLELDKHLSGGLLLNENTGYLELTREDLNKGNLKLRVAWIDLLSVPRTELKIEDLGQMGQIEMYSKKYRYSALKPTIS